MDDWEHLAAEGIAWGRRRGLPREAAEDLAQDAVLSLLTKEGTIGSRRAWLLGTLQRLFLKRLRRRYRRGAAQLLLDGTATEIQAVPRPSAEQRLDLCRALTETPPKLRRVVLLSCYYGLSADEITAHEGIDRQEVYLRKRRAIRALRRRLG